MKQLKFNSIRTRLTYWFLLLTLIPLIFILIITYFQRVSVIEDRTFDKLTAIRDLKVSRLTDWLSEREGDMKTMSEDKELTSLEFIINNTSYNESDETVLTNGRKLLNRYLKNYPAYNELFIINSANGKIFVSTKSFMEGEDRSSDEYFTVPMSSRKLSIKDIYYSNTLTSHTMVYSIPIFCSHHTDAHIIGILVARIDLHNSLYKMLLDRVGLGETGETLIVNKDVVALNELRWYANAPLNLQISAEPAVNAANGERGITITKDYRNENILAAYTYIPETGWGFVCKQDMYELNAPVRQLIWNFIIIFSITSIVILLLAIKISKSISKPIIEMNGVAYKFASGDLLIRNTIISQDELGSLASEFNKMANVIEARLQTQKGVVEISEMIITTTSIQEFGSEILKQLMTTTSATMSAFYILNETTLEYEHSASIGANEKFLRSFSAKNLEGEISNAISKKRIYYLRDIPETTIFSYKAIVGKVIPKEIITIPILVESTVVAVISLINIHKFSEESYEILKQSWSGINVSYSNLMSNERTNILAEQLSRTNQNLESQTEELQEQSEELQNQAIELRRTSEELQEQNEELNAQRKQVETANKMKSEFLSNMSHELRTPLNSIMALSRVLLTQAKNKLDKEEYSYIGIVERNGKRLLSLINDILDLSKIEAGKMEVQPVSISVPLILQIIKDNLQQISEEKHLTLNLNIANEFPEIESDETKIHQIITNIVGNAVKFTKKGAVEIKATFDSNNIHITVTDSGIGISTLELPYIFDEFRQADGSSSRLYEGTGLGLAIANKLTNILGGNIKVESTLGEGSMFKVTLPIKWHEDVLLTERYSFENVSTKQMNKTILVVDDDDFECKDSNKKRILMVEDNVEAIIQVKTVLEKEGIIIDVAKGGKEALEYIKHTVPDGIILDLMMPDIDGFEVLEKLRGTDRTQNIPVLVLTAKDLSRKDLSKLSANNIQQLIQKGDINIDGLVHKVNLLLSRSSKLKKDIEIKKNHEGNNLIKKKESFVKSDLPTILIIEDNADNMITIKAILKGKYDISEAVDGKEGLKKAQTLLPNVILLDMALPKISGEEIIKILRKNKKIKHIAVIAVTAQAMKGDKEKILALGCDAYVSKPVDQKLLLAEIEKLVSNHPLQ